MKILGIFWFASILSSGLAILSPLPESTDRELIYPIAEPNISSYDTSENRTVSFKNEFNVSQNYKHQRNFRRDPELWRNQSTDFRKNESYYVQKNIQGNSSIPNGYEKGMTTTIFRTYGRGKAQVMRQGQTVYVPNELGRNASGYKVSLPLSGTVLKKNENEIKAVRHHRGCKECPSDQTVITTKGNTFVILPEPCQINPRMWIHHSGPRPGSKIPEGVHLIRGYIGPNKKFCQYHYKVSVRRCELLKVKEDTTVECSAENSWGSVCLAFCKYEKDSTGPTQLECKENLTWSNSLPKCKGQTNCSTIKLKTNSKISCQTANMTQVKGDFIPNGSTCKFIQNEKEISINCKDGKWRIIRKNKNLTKNQKQKIKKKPDKKDACNPNPCQNGGTCLKSESNKGSPICKCRSQTRGVHCEMRECYYNICENDGLCFFQNEERTCYCTSDYRGDTCQYYVPQ